MRRMYVMLGDEMLHWPDVRTNPMFEMRTIYHSKLVFAIDSGQARVSDTESIMYSFAKDTEKKEGKKSTLY